MTSIAQHPLDCLNLPPRSVRRRDKVGAFKPTRNIFKVCKGVQRQLDGALKTMDRANGPDMQFDNVRHDSVFLCSESPQMRSNPFQNRRNPFRAEKIRDEIKATVRKLAEPIEAGESVKAQQNKVARKTGLGPRRVEKLWYGLIPKPLAEDLERVRHAYANWLAEREANMTRELEKLRNDLDELR